MFQTKVWDPHAKKLRLKVSKRVLSVKEKMLKNLPHKKFYQRIGPQSPEVCKWTVGTKNLQVAKT